MLQLWRLEAWKGQGVALHFFYVENEEAAQKKAEEVLKEYPDETYKDLQPMPYGFKFVFRELPATKEQPPG